jgi:hypothetical protein
MSGRSRAAGRAARVLLVCAATIVLCASAMAGMLFAMRAAWTPAPGFSSSVVFWNERVSHAADWWPRILGMEVLWSAALVVLVTTLLIARPPAPNHFVRALLAGEFLLLAVFAASPMPLDADQYAYVAYADLVDRGYSPYDPPAKRDVLTPQLHEAATVWNNGEGGSDARERVVVRDKYGPALTLAMAAALAPFRDASLEAQARVLRLLASLACIVITLLLWDELRDRPWGPAALAAFAFNPLVVTQTAIGAHDDLFAVLPALLAYRFAARGRYAPAALFLGVSAACKLTFVPFALPLLAFAYGRTRRPAVVLAMIAVLFAVPLLLAIPFGWSEALIRPYRDAQAYNASLLFGYLGSAAQRITHVPGLAQAVRHWLGPSLIVLCAASLAALALRRRREAILEAALLLLLFTAARQQTWYALNVIPLLLIPRPWAIGVFLGCTLASQAIQRKNFIGGWDAPPFVPFLVVALVASAALAVAFTVLGRTSIVRKAGFSERSHGRAAR